HCLQMGHAWKSELDSPIKSENSDFQSLPDWDSSLGLDVMSWRNTEEEAMGKLEGSSQEADHEMELSEPLWKDDSEDYHEAEKPCENDSLLQFLSEVGLLGLQEGGQHSSGPPETLGFAGPSPSIPTETVWGNSRSSGFTFSPAQAQRFLPFGTPKTIPCPCRFSSPFLKPVSEKQAPGYRDVVKRPMDLSSIKRRLSKGHIQSVMQFQCDLMLMFQNAVMYNSSDHHVFHVAVEMQREVLEQLQVLAEALLLSRDRLE
uniref:Bromo domain-containing protein n=1 Tax=Serinus canaria TaxID=9135 RepID=A0A8C9KPF3_SERCA